MDYKNLIKTQLDDLKRMGFNRRKIEKELGYSAKYIDQSLSRGGNDTLLNALSSLKSRLEVEGSNQVNEDGVSYISKDEHIRILTGFVETQKSSILILTEKNKELQAKLREMRLLFGKKPKISEDKRMQKKGS
jgi:hypothetical protein